MRETVSETRFIEVMASSYHGFSYEGAKELFSILSEFEEENGTELELDPIAIRSQFTEYESIEEMEKDYPDWEENGPLYYPFSHGIIVDVESY